MSEDLRQEITTRLIDEVRRRATGSTTLDAPITVIIRSLHEHALLLGDSDFTMIAQDATDALRSEDIVVTIQPKQERIFIVNPVGHIPEPR